jgi:hypothetical protein
MKNLEYQNWYLDKKRENANILYERLSKLATGKEVVLEQESKISQPAQSADKNKQAEQLIKLPQAQSSLVKNTNKIFGIDNGTTEGKQFNNVLSDFYGSFFKDMAASPDPKKPEPSASSIELAKKVVESYAKYVSGEFSSAGKEVSSLSKAKASGETIYKDIKKRLSSLFENANKEDKILLKEFLPALGAGAAAFATGIAEVIGAIITAIGPAIASLGLGGVGVIAFGYFMYKVMSNPKVHSAADKMVGVVETGAEAGQEYMTTLKKGGTAASNAVGAAQVRTQQLERSQLQSQCIKNTPKYIPGMPVKSGQIYRIATDPNNLTKQSVVRVGRIYDDGSWDPEDMVECSKIEN